MQARYPNLPGGIEVSPGYGGMVSEKDADWTPPDFNKFGPVHFYTDNASSHDRPNGGWFEHYMIGVGRARLEREPPLRGAPLHTPSRREQAGSAPSTTLPSRTGARATRLAEAPSPSARRRG